MSYSINIVRTEDPEVSEWLKEKGIRLSIEVAYMRFIGVTFDWCGSDLPEAIQIQFRQVVLSHLTHIGDYSEFNIQCRLIAAISMVFSEMTRVDRDVCESKLKEEAK